MSRQTNPSLIRRNRARCKMISLARSCTSFGPGSPPSALIERARRPRSGRRSNRSFAGREGDGARHLVVEPLLAEAFDVVAGQIVHRLRAAQLVDLAVDGAAHRPLERRLVRRILPREGGTDEGLEPLVPQAVQPVLAEQR